MNVNIAGSIHYDESGGIERIDAESAWETVNSDGDVINTGSEGRVDLSGDVVEVRPQ